MQPPLGHGFTSDLSRVVTIKVKRRRRCKRQERARWTEREVGKGARISGEAPKASNFWTPGKGQKGRKLAWNHRSTDKELQRGNMW